MQTTTDERRRDRGALVDELRRAGARFKGEKHCHCPFHDDRDPSAGVYEEGGVWRFKCHGCGVSGDIFDIRARVRGVTLAEVLKEAGGVVAEPAPNLYPTLDALCSGVACLTARYVYTNPATLQPDLIVLRRDFPDGKKSFIQARPERGGYVMKAPTGLLPLYNRLRVRDAEAVTVVEGEKCVHALHDIGVVATTAPGGAGRARMADWTPLAGKTVYLWPDNDAPAEGHPEGRGVTHMREVEKILETLTPAVQIFWIDPTTLGLPPKGDGADFIAANGGTAEDKSIAVKLVLDEAEPRGVARALGQHLEDIITGRWKNIEWPWDYLTQAARSLLPGTITVLPGDPGSGKSFFLLEAMWYWHMAGYRVALFELEEDRTYHLKRALAQIANNSSLTDDLWVRGNAEEAREAFRSNAGLVETFGRCLWEAPEREVPLAELEAWVEARAAEGCEVIGIDPVTAAAVGKERWLDDQRFIYNVKTILRRYGARLVLVTHPKESGGRNRVANLGGMAGGKAYERFSQSVLWLRRHDRPRREEVERVHGSLKLTFDREVQVRKARNGPGAGTNIAFVLSPATLRFEELGVVVDQERKQAERAATEEAW